MSYAISILRAATSCSLLPTTYYLIYCYMAIVVVRVVSVCNPLGGVNNSKAIWQVCLLEQYLPIGNVVTQGALVICSLLMFGMLGSMIPSHFALRFH